MKKRRNADTVMFLQVIYFFQKIAKNHRRRKQKIVHTPKSASNTGSKHNTLRLVFLQVHTYATHSKVRTSCEHKIIQAPTCPCAVNHFTLLFFRGRTGHSMPFRSPAADLLIGGAVGIIALPPVNFRCVQCIYKDNSIFLWIISVRLTPHTLFSPNRPSLILGNFLVAIRTFLRECK